MSTGINFDKTIVEKNVIVIRTLLFLLCAWLSSFENNVSVSNSLLTFNEGFHHKKKSFFCRWRPFLCHAI